MLEVILREEARAVVLLMRRRLDLVSNLVQTMESPIIYRSLQNVLPPMLDGSKLCAYEVMQHKRALPLVV